MPPSAPEQVLLDLGLGRDGLAKMVTLLQSDASSILHDQLLFSSPSLKPSIDLTKITDDMDDYFKSFMDRADNNFGTPSAITDIAANYRQRHEGALLPDQMGYRRSMEQFLEYMLVLFLLVGGQPDQGPEIFARGKSPEVVGELVAIKHKCARPTRKDVMVAPRSLYFEYGMVAIITVDNYSPDGIRGRYLKPDVSEMIILYLAVVLPFFRTLSPEDSYSESDFFFASPRGFWHTARYDNILKRETRKKLGVKLGLVELNEMIKKMQKAMKAP